MKGFIKRGMVLVIMAVLLTGCGDEMFPLTEGEEAIIVNYSSGTLAKHNRRQQEGLTMVAEREEEEEAEEPILEEETKETEGQDTERPADNRNDSARTEEDKVTQVTLTEALGIPGMEFSYTNYSVTSHYQQGEVYSLDASSGNTYLMLNINITNTGSEAAECDVMTKQPVFKLKVDDNSRVQSLFTLLENDLSTYTATVEPGQTVAAVLLFEVPETVTENISNLQLNVEMNGNTSEIKMK